MRRIIMLLTVALIMGATMALGAGVATAEPFGPNDTPGGCVGADTAVIAQENNGMGSLNTDPSSSPDQEAFVTAGDWQKDFATGECQEERGL
jgi:hypothetical protein